MSSMARRGISLPEAQKRLDRSTLLRSCGDWGIPVVAERPAPPIYGAAAGGNRRPKWECGQAPEVRMPVSITRPERQLTQPVQIRPAPPFIAKLSAYTRI